MASRGTHVKPTHLWLAASGRSSAFLVSHADFYRFRSYARLPGHIGEGMLLFGFRAKSDKAVAFREARFIKDDLTWKESKIGIKLLSLSEVQYTILTCYTLGYNIVLGYG